MNNLQKAITNKYLYLPFLVWFCIQTFKVIYELIKTKKFNFKRIVGAGGMPSSHSAIAMCIATMIGKAEGFDSNIFALALIFALVVMYDAAGVRRAAGKHAGILNSLMEIFKEKEGLKFKQTQLKELLGHEPTEVIAGAVLGIVVSLVMIGYLRG